jgi:aspartyl-tRNA(Asn)/glutamyl-tRNA(Gln) amidotransferase subunit A
MKPILELAADLASGRTTSRTLVEEALARIEDPHGEGGRVFLAVHAEAARAAAEASDNLRAVGIVPSPIAGLPISLKDLFDEAGHVTRAGSRTREDAPPAARDSVVAARLRAAGAVIIGRTNLTEFAYSGIGINPHFGTPRNPWDRAIGRIPGGSSAGAAVSVTDGMAAAGIGTDTGGSVRIPAALCGLTGFKTTSGRIPLDGCFALSQTLDSVGPLATTVTCCAILDGIMRGVAPEIPEPLPIAGLRLAIPKTLVMDGADDYVSSCYARALARLADAGASLTEIAFAELGEIPVANRQGGIQGAEAWANHRRTLETKGDLVDPRVRVRIERGQHLSAADYVDSQNARADIIARANAVTAPFDAVLMPTVPCIAPKIADIVASDDLYFEMNPFILRNNMLGNFLDRCALSIPMHEPGDAPAGLMLMGETGADDRLVRIGLAVESTLRPQGTT